MKIKFLGVGEAFDEKLPNTSIWVRSETADGGRASVLLDCGFTAPSPFWQSCPDPDELDAIWISHFHGDHFFGIPALLTRSWEMGRKKPLILISQAGVEDIIRQTLKLAYSSIMEKFAFELRFREVEPGNTIEAAGLSWSTALNGHPQKDLAVRIGRGEKSVFYSGDGLSTDDTLALAKGCPLIIHEAFRLDRQIPGHGSILSSIEFARKAGAQALALVHIQRNERRDRREEILRSIETVRDLRVFMPEPGEEVEI